MTQKVLYGSEAPWWLKEYSTDFWPRSCQGQRSFWSAIEYVSGSWTLVHVVFIDFLLRLTETLFSSGRDLHYRHLDQLPDDVRQRIRRGSVPSGSNSGPLLAGMVPYRSGRGDTVRPVALRKQHRRGTYPLPAAVDTNPPSAPSGRVLISLCQVTLCIRLRNCRRWDCRSGRSGSLVTWYTVDDLGVTNVRCTFAERSWMFAECSPKVFSRPKRCGGRRRGTKLT